MKKCEKCGAMLNDEAKFCTNCGAASSVPPMGQQAQAGPHVVNQAPPVQQPVYPQNQPYAQGYGYYQPPMNPQPKVSLSPKEAILKAMGSGTFLTTAIMLSISVAFGALAFYFLVRNLEYIIGKLIFFDLFDEIFSLYGISLSELVQIINNHIFLIILTMHLPLILILAGTWITYAGGKKKSTGAAKAGIIFLIFDIGLVSAPFIILPVYMIVEAFNVHVRSSDVFVFGLLMLAFYGFLFIPAIIACIRAALVLNEKDMKSYTMPVVAASLITMGIFITLYGLAFLALSSLYGLSVILFSVTCYISASIVISYNSKVKRLKKAD